MTRTIALPGKCHRDYRMQSTTATNMICGGALRTWGWTDLMSGVSRSVGITGL